jgi:hypothetical protein
MSGRWCCGWRERMRRGVTAASTASSRRSASPWRRQRSAALPRSPRRQNTTNPHVLVTKQTKAGQAPASTAYLSHVLDGCGVSLRTIRSTRLVDLVNTLDPKLVAAAFGMDPQAPLIYLADAVDPTRVPDNLERT